MGNKLSQVCLTATLFLISLALIFVITAAQGVPGKIAVQGHPSPSAHSAVGQNPPSGSRQGQHNKVMYNSLKEGAAECSSRTYASCMADKPAKPVCSPYNRACGRN
nr:hypothetical protein Itr_chr13CG00470 [Ipomoea trifida]GME12955.1 hypothetical protein Iba_scaffold14287CG0040 [Ipomoea batatas]GME14234.1 hypothetical protein Iba_scaffold15032CG0030 [Ipomoea batatas]GME15967.1 hypothetical protein Iba_scaffold16883CG0780 [Ipomoea batatas]